MKIFTSIALSKTKKKILILYLTYSQIFPIDKKFKHLVMPSRRRLTIVERLSTSGSHSVRSLPLLLAPSNFDTSSYPRGKLINGEEAPFGISLSQTNRLVFISFY